MGKRNSNLRVMDFSDNFFERLSLSFDKKMYEMSKKFKSEAITEQYPGVNFKYLDDNSVMTNNNNKITFSIPLSQSYMSGLDEFKKSFDGLMNTRELQMVENIIFTSDGFLIDAQSGQQLPFVYKK